MLFFVYATEDFFYGLHGIYDYQFVEDGELDRKYLDNIGEELSYGVMDMFSYCLPYYDECCENDDETEGETLGEHTVWGVYRVKDGITVERAMEIVGRECGPETFIYEYCEEVD